MEAKKVQFDGLFPLDCGDQLAGIEVAYHTYGTLNTTKDNVIWVCHALTANSEVEDWWPGMVGPGLLFDTRKYFIVCANIIGSCYGTTGPATVDPSLGKPLGKNFPLITVRDMVRAHQLLRNHLEIKKILLITGSSLGGQQALEWSYSEPELFQYLVPIATSAIASPWGIAFNESQRMALEADPDFQKGIFTPESAGLRAARSIALLSYRNGNTYNKTQQETDPDKYTDHKASSYQQYQGLKLQKRFDPFSYHIMTRALDSQNIGRGRGGVEEALKAIKAKTLTIGISSDLLFPVEEQKRIAAGITGARYEEIDSFYGHDGFLLEVDLLTRIIKEFIAQEYDNE